MIEKKRENLKYDQQGSDAKKKVKLDGKRRFGI